MAGTVNRVEPRAIILDVGKNTEAILATTEQSALEHYRIGQNVKAFVLEVRRSVRGPQIFVSRTHKGFLRRLFELSGADGASGADGGSGVDGDVQLTFLSVGGRRIASGIHFVTPDAILYYNAGLDPAAMELSPGVLLVSEYIRLAIDSGRRRLDFLRGDEAYKYQWGAIDEPIRRLLVRRTGGRA